jgi:hypothetical protein
VRSKAYNRDAEAIDLFKKGEFAASVAEIRATLESFTNGVSDMAALPNGGRNRC